MTEPATVTFTRDHLLARDRRVLLAVLLAARAERLPVPCQDVGPADGALWTSEDQGDQRLAARLCEPCAGREACEAYGRAWPKEAGVYGGMTERDRRPIGRPRKNTTQEEDMTETTTETMTEVSR